MTLENGGWVRPPLPKKNKSSTVVKITRESEGHHRRRPEGLVWRYAALVHQGLDDAADDAPDLCRPRRDGACSFHGREVLCEAERPHDDLELDGTVIAGPTGARDVEASGPLIVTAPDHHDVDFPDFISLRRWRPSRMSWTQSARYALRHRRMRRSRDDDPSHRQEESSLTWKC